MHLDATQIGVMGLTGMLGLLGLVAIIGGFLHFRRERLLSHAERMKALELGREVLDDPATVKARAEAEAAEEKTYAGKCFSTALYSCFWGFLFAIGAANKEGGNAPGAAYAIAAAAGAVGVTGLICGTVLAIRSPAAREPAPAKVRFDPEGI